MIYDLVISGKLVTKKGIEDSTICIKDGKIAKLGHGEANQSVHLNDSSLIFPGFIDAHVHMREDPTQQWSYKEDFMSGSRAAINGGVSVVADMPNTPEPASDRSKMLKKLELAKRSPIGIMLYGAVFTGNMDKLNEISDLVCGYKVYAAETTSNSLTHMLLHDLEKIEKAVEILSGTGKPITFHCSNNMEDIIKICKKHNVKTHIAHVSEKNEIEIIKKYKNKMQLTCETCPHYLFFTKSDCKNSIFRVNPSIGDEKDKHALLDAVKNGVIDFIATDHAPHTLKDKEEGSVGVPGLDTYSNLISWLMVNQGIRPEQIIELTSENPAKHLDIATGINEGSAANLTVIDMQKTEVTKQNLQTKQKWSPYQGHIFPGRATHTIYHGRIL